MGEGGTRAPALTPLRQALLTIERLEAELERRDRAAAASPVAIRSTALRFPGASDLDGLARLLWAGEDATSEAPPSRWDVDGLHDARSESRGTIVTRRGGFLADEIVAGFDAAFFGISPREAIHVDPQQRLLLELAWEAIERAGIAPDALRGTRTGVFIGIGIGDWATRLARAGGLADIDAYTGIGTGFAFAAGRVAFHLGLQGPTMAVDTACSSSLVAVHLACQSLRAGECDLALVGGVHLMLAPETMVVLSRTGALAPDGRCKTFDARADGYGRGEGAAMLLLSRAGDVAAGSPRPLGMVRGSAVNHDGPSSALTVPNGPAQQAVIARALAVAGVDGRDVGYVEAHGTGTALGDPMEVGALAAVLGGERPAPLRLGSIKTNIGHLEAAAGVAGLLKLCLVLERGEVPPHLHLRRRNPLVAWDTLPVEIPTATTAWSAGRPRVGGVSAFGLSGTNAHVIVEAAPAVEMAAAVGSGPVVCELSARTPSALRALAERAAAHVEASVGTPLAWLAYSLSACRARLPHRLAVVASSHAELASGLRARAAAEPVAAAPVVFLFTGQGSPYPGMGGALYASEPVFRAVVDECDHIAAGLMPVLPGAAVRGEIDAARLTDTAIAQPALYVLQVALARLWASWGVAPEIVIGHSVGEIAAAHVAGAIGLADGLHFAIVRGRAMGALPPGGAMVSVRAEAARVEPLLAGRRVSLAAVNAPGQSVIAGERAAVDAVVRELERAGVAAVPLAVSHAFHSPLMEPALEAIGAAAPAAVAPGVTFVSTLSGRVRAEALDADYWRRQARGAVRYADAARAAWAAGGRAFVEIGPRPTLLGLTAASVPEATVLLPSLKPGTVDGAVMRAGLVALAERGAPVAVAATFAPDERRYVDVPTYPFEHERFWIDLAPRATVDVATVSEVAVVPHGLLGAPTRLASGETQWRARLEASGPLADHRLGGYVVVPLSTTVDAALVALRAAGTGVPRLESLELRQPLFLPAGEPQELAIVVTPRGEQAAIVVRARDADAGGDAIEVAVATGHGGGGDAALAVTRELDALRARAAAAFPLEALFAGLAERGIEYGPAFRGIAEAWRGDGELLARVDAAAEPTTLLDLAVQAVGMAATEGERSGLLFPSAVAGVSAAADVSAAAWVHATATMNAEGAVGAAELLAADGRVLARFDEVRLARAEVRQLLAARDARVQAWAHQVVWREVDAGSGDLGGRWLLVSDGGAAGTAALRALRSAGAQVVQAVAGPAWRVLAPDLVEIDGEQSVAAALAHARDVLGGAPDVLHLGGLAANDPASAGRAVDEVLAVARALARAEADSRLVIVTRGAQAVADGEAPRLSLFQAPLWGLGRALAVEAPELRVGLVDLDSEALVDHGADVLAALAHAGENQVARRDGATLAARLVPAPAVLAGSGLAIAADGTYLVTGGLGGLGLQIVEHLASRGARRIAILGRRGPDAASATRLDALRERGTEVVVAACDIADPLRLAEALAAIERSDRPLRGVVHAAAVIDDAPLAEQHPARVAAVLAPKLAGTWNLHTQLAGRRLDFFVGFSSLVSIMGSPGQASYAAANAFLDGFAVRRRGEGHAATTVAWGPWAGAGTAQTLADQRRWGELGLAKIPPSLGLRALELAAGSAAPALAVLPIAWDRFLARLPADATPPIYAELRERFARATPARGLDEALLARLAAAGSAEARRPILLAHLQAEAARVLRLPSPDAATATRPLNELGFDSLLTVELRNAVQQSLGVTVKVSALFEHPTLGGLAEYLARGSAAAPIVALPRPAPRARAGRAVDLSLIYFASGTSGPDHDKYRHVLDQARLADELGWKAIWIPERHFFELGALYPDPSLLAAALAPVTRQIRLRAGSVVVPLHHPVHLAERWAMVDNLSGGRVDLSVATGWSPVDFVVAPERYAERVQAMRDGTAALQKLWRGEAIELTSGTGESTRVRAFPRPVQPELPIWYTCSGGIERFVEAGAAGANVLTALLFQTYDQLAEKIAAYRRARAEAGHDPATGCVTLMLHAYAHEDAERVIPTIRAPFLAYLESTARVWLEASTADTVRSVEKMSADERADVLEMAFRRYVHSAGLFGTPDVCRDRLAELSAQGVDEVACLVDFGVAPELVAESVRCLSGLVGAAAPADDEVEEMVL